MEFFCFQNSPKHLFLSSISLPKQLKNLEPTYKGDLDSFVLARFRSGKRNPLVTFRRPEVSRKLLEKGVG